ncbi:MAG: TonB-dependent receptor [Bacteroidales bacterium]|nr:TonB-dependent receptor [Candidatus Cacconaster equi]
MKKFILLMVAVLGAVQLRAQNDGSQLYVSKLDAQQLVDFIKKEVNPGIFFVKDTSDKRVYTVRASREDFLSEAFKELKANSYSVTEYDGKYFILRNLGFSTELPAGYFLADQQENAGISQEMARYLESEKNIATFQNKIYEIGEKGPVSKAKAMIRGHVRDVLSGEPLVGVAVYDNNGSAYAQTDADGYYKIMMPTGFGELGFSGYSLEDMKLHVEVYDDGNLDVMMKEKVFSLTGAVITSESKAQHRVTQMGIEKVRVNAIKNVPAVFGESDALKVVMTLPGVKSVGEAATGFNVRGGSVDQNLILFNDGTIYNPSHMFGILSSFNTDVLSDVQLYKSSIPAEYGGRISSVLEVKTRDGNSRKVKGSVGLGLLTSRLELEGPIVKDRTTFILGARTTYSNWILKLLPASSGFSGGSSSFQDVNLGLSHKVNDRNTLHAYGYFSRDKFSFSKDTTYRYNNINGSLKWNSNFSDNHSMTATVGFDQYNYKAGDTFNPAEAYQLSSRIRQYSGKLVFKSMLSENHTLTYGASGIWYDLNPGSYEPFGDSSLVKARYLDRQTAAELAAYVSDTWRITDKLSFDAGIRYSQFVPTDGKQKKSYGGPEFRLSGKYSFTDNFSWKAGFNTMRQYIHMISNSVNISPTDTWTLSSDKIRPQTGWQAAMGLYWTFLDNTVDLSLEGYYKKVDHYIDYKSGAVLVMNENLADDLFETQNRAYGVELMIKKNIGKLNGWISYTYSRSMLRQSDPNAKEVINNGQWYSAPYDKPHDIKVVGNYKFTHRYSLSVNFDYSTGRPVTLPVGKYQYAGGTRLVYSDRNSYRIPDYMRLDLAIIIEPGHYLKQLTHLSFTIGCYNVTGRKNPYSVFFTTNGGAAISGHMLSVFATQIPYVNFNLKF